MFGFFPIPNLSVGSHTKSGQQGIVLGVKTNPGRLAQRVLLCTGIAGDICRPCPFQRHLLQGIQLDLPWRNKRQRPDGSQQGICPIQEGDIHVPFAEGFQGCPQRGEAMQDGESR